MDWDKVQVLQAPSRLTLFAELESARACRYDPGGTQYSGRGDSRRPQCRTPNSLGEKTVLRWQRNLGARNPTRRGVLFWSDSRQPALSPLFQSAQLPCRAGRQLPPKPLESIPIITLRFLDWTPTTLRVDMHPMTKPNTAGGKARSALAEESRRPKSNSSRRSFLVGLAATGAIAAFSKRTAALQGGPAASAKATRIDTHHHFTIPKLFELSTAKGVNQPTLKGWTPEKSIEDMNQGGLATSIIP